MVESGLYLKNILNYSRFDIIYVNKYEYEGRVDEI